MQYPIHSATCIGTAERPFTFPKALLLAPKSGADTRKYLSKTTKDGRQAMEESGRELMERGKELYERGKKIAEDATDLFEKGRKLVQG